jgi:hypothetical protein
VGVDASARRRLGHDTGFRARLEASVAWGGEREYQRGPFAQVTWGPITIASFWFNPGSRDQVFVGSIGVTF